MNIPVFSGFDWHGEDVSGWWISEKCNGWRCLWTGTQFLTKSGKPYHPPRWFLDTMPRTALDCELWAGRGRNNDDVNRLVHAGQWHALTLRPFDIPVVGLSIEDAIETLRTLALPPHVRLVEHRRVSSTAEAIGFMRSIVREHGEGAMARRPGSSYGDGRSTDILKLKPVFA